MLARDIYRLFSKSQDFFMSTRHNQGLTRIDRLDCPSPDCLFLTEADATAGNSSQPDRPPEGSAK